MTHFDVAIIGAGAAGMMAAIEAGKRGRKVLIFDHARAPGEKIRISGGGRCNFTNVHTRPDRFLSHNPRFAISALARYTPAHFIRLVERYGIAFHEKTLGQLFCDGSSQQIINLLVAEMAHAGVTLQLGTSLEQAERTGNGFRLALSGGPVTCESLIVASGGKSIPRMGATGLGYRLAAQFGLRVTETRPGLVPLTFEPGMLERLAPLAGVATEVAVTANRQSFREAMLFTHRGLSGPAILQISSYWREGDALGIDLLPDANVLQLLRRARKETPRTTLQTVLAARLPKRLAQMKTEEIGLSGQLGDFSDQKFAQVEAALKHWTIKPTGTEGYRTAEATLGGVDTADLDSTTMAARNVPGLYFVGECVDVTGWLGGYNFQWAWASGWAAGQVA
ncbi:MAG: BaiN/RdsA family NAD(P)/FAD-dependent oxidoreductase [Devosia sp.]